MASAVVGTDKCRKRIRSHTPAERPPHEGEPATDKGTQRPGLHRSPLVVQTEFGATAGTLAQVRWARTKQLPINPGRLALLTG
jgi:hypothetical protein